MSEGSEAYECYVCLQDCDNKSPCRCESYVHKECLNKIGKSYCTVCKEDFNSCVYVAIEEEPQEGGCLLRCNYRYFCALFLICILSFTVSVVALGGCCTYANLILFVCCHFMFMAMYIMTSRRRH